jgi:hypothetical protein
MFFNYNRPLFLDRMEPFQHIVNADMEEWSNDPLNIYYMDNEDIALFNFEKTGLYSGHYFFSSRGKQAREKAKKIIKDFFLRSGATSIRGLTPVENKAARWMNRQLGFQSFGLVETEDKEWCELFILTRKDIL